MKPYVWQTFCTRSCIFENLHRWLKNLWKARLGSFCENLFYGNVWEDLVCVSENISVYIYILYILYCIIQYLYMSSCLWGMEDDHYNDHTLVDDGPQVPEAPKTGSWTVGIMWNHFGWILEDQLPGRKWDRMLKVWYFLYLQISSEVLIYD